MAILAAILLSASAAAFMPSPSAPDPVFRPVPSPPRTAVAPRTTPTVDSHGLQKAPEPSRPRVAVPEPRARVVAPPATPGPAGSKVSGTATWYCLQGVSPCHYAKSAGAYAAAGSEVRRWLGPKWRGQHVTVCQGDDCVRVKLIDWCACGGRRIIDLYSDAFRQLSPLGAGVIEVTVRR